LKTKNEQFFENKTYEQILGELKFDRHLKHFEKKFKNKKIAIYGAGIMFDYIIENYDLSGFDIIAISDKRFEYHPVDFHKGIKAYSPSELLNNKDIDVILISTLYPVGMKGYLEKVIYEGVKSPKIYFLLNKPFALYWEEIF